MYDGFDDLIRYDAFFFFETERRVNTGLGFGAKKNHEAVGKMLEYYNGRHFAMDNRLQLEPCPKGNTESLRVCYPELKMDGTSQVIANTRIMSLEEYRQRMKHYGEASWVSDKGGSRYSMSIKIRD